MPTVTIYLNDELYARYGKMSEKRKITLKERFKESISSND